MATSKKVKQAKRKRRTPLPSIEYYTRPFLLLGMEFTRRGIPRTPHPLRESFWRLIPPGEYPSLDARHILLSYLHRIEIELSRILGRQSLGYWLHLYRRIAPMHPYGENDDFATILWVREILESAIQKYSSFDKCDRIAVSDEISPSEVFKGLLMAPEFELERLFIQKTKQLVLTNFGVDEMQEFYDVERLSFEIWRGTAVLRVLGKGGSLVVDTEDPYFYDSRSDELDRLLTNYDHRYRDPNVTATGTVFAGVTSQAAGHEPVLVPFYNVRGIQAKDLAALFRLFRLKLFSPNDREFRTNFVWGPFGLRSYYEAHLPFANSFENVHRLPLSWLLAVIGALCWRAFYIWTEIPTRILHYWQRAYEGPYKKEYILQEIRTFLPVGIRILDLQVDGTDIDVETVFSFIQLSKEKRSDIDLVLAGPHFTFLPFNDDRYFIDYCWLYRFLYHLFYGVDVSDQNFKGAALERLVHGGSSVLPTGPCKSVKGEMRQIDAAFDMGDTLVIAECRAVARSLAFDRGDTNALRYRQQVVDKALKDVDEKAYWLSRNPVGSNFDITRFKRILPIAVTPFVEYIPSIAPSYWLTDELPRVITPSELRDALDSGILKTVGETSHNALHVCQ